MLMLAQFQRLYPNGCITTELVQIFQGKYIVRASVQIDNVTRATGMAGAEAIEVAEDQARARALMVLGISNSPQTSVEFSSQPRSREQLNPANSAEVKLNQPGMASYSPTDQEFGRGHWSAANVKESVPAVSEQNTKNESGDYGHTYRQEFSPAVEKREKMADHQGEVHKSGGNFGSNVTPFIPRTNAPQELDTQTGVGKKNNKNEPVDLSDVIAKTDVELQRLGWTAEQGRDHLIKTYGKKGRTLLTEEELYGFLKHLESQPDPIAGF